jgi:hypothetical protein
MACIGNRIQKQVAKPIKLLHFPTDFFALLLAYGLCNFHALGLTNMSALFSTFSTGMIDRVFATHLVCLARDIKTQCCHSLNLRPDVRAQVLVPPTF